MSHPCPIQQAGNLNRFYAPTNTAEVIANLFHNDGHTFEVDSPDGRSFDLDEICCLHARCDADLGPANKRQYVFPDDSAITIQAEAWDIGFASCWCMSEEGHSQECREQGGCE